jgi:hypothetical protein
VSCTLITKSQLELIFLVTCKALRGDTENTPLQVKLNNLAEIIAKLGSAAGLILFTALMIRFLVSLGPVLPARYVNMLDELFARC